ncbi:MAG: hypothetical protein AVDCRST_MAG11-2125, partial [uncultured Gemmatimonadaceae bacterium]
ETNRSVGSRRPRPHRHGQHGGCAGRRPGTGARVRRLFRQARVRVDARHLLGARAVRGGQRRRRRRRHQDVCQRPLHDGGADAARVVPARRRRAVAAERAARREPHRGARRPRHPAERLLRGDHPVHPVQQGHERLVEPQHRPARPVLRGRRRHERRVRPRLRARGRGGDPVRPEDVPVDVVLRQRERVRAARPDPDPPGGEPERRQGLLVAAAAHRGHHSDRQV